MYNILIFYDQIQAGMGTKDDSLVPLGIKKEVVGPAVMMANYLKENNAKIAGCIYCGTKYYLNNKEEVTRKIVALIDKVRPDAVIFGPTFDYKDFSTMATEICSKVSEQTDIATVVGMSKENTEIYEKYKDKVDIVDVPKKGGLGLNDALNNLVKRICEKLR